MKGDTVILAAGDFPKKGGTPWKLLTAAARVICCDSAGAAYHRRFHRWPDAIVGDGDSLKVKCPKEIFIRVPEQETNDLEKAVRWCAEKGWSRPLVLGATGKREDHTLGNIFRALDLGVEIVTETGRFLPFEGTLRLKTGKAKPLSVFAVNPATRMKSRGLAWPLEEVRFTNLYCAALNRTTADVVELTTTHRALVYQPFGG